MAKTSGMGKHESELSYSEAEENRKAVSSIILKTKRYLKTTKVKQLWTSIIIYNLGLTSTKMSILLQYQRIFPQKRFPQLFGAAEPEYESPAGNQSPPVWGT